MALIECVECGSKISDKAMSCPNCGIPLSDTELKTQNPIVVTPPKSRSLAIAFALLLGGIGIHKFYLNKPGWGFLYIIFCWTFIPAILGLLEGIVWLFTSEEKFQEQFGQQEISKIKTSGSNNEVTKNIEAKPKSIFFHLSWIAGILFWPGVVHVVWPMFSGGGREEVTKAWELSQWLMGLGFVLYVGSEIVRNIVEKKK
jgi:TM2 domain-containing membrane protein YozV